MLGKKRNPTSSIIPPISTSLPLQQSLQLPLPITITSSSNDLSKHLFSIQKSSNAIPPSLITSNKPLWISDVSHSIKQLFPNPMENKDFQQIQDLMQMDTSSQSYDIKEYPYYQTIKKIMYAFGDTYDNNHETVLHMHDFIKSFIVNLTKIFSECDFKKIIDHFFSYEYEKLHNYKKLNFKNKIITGENDSITGEELRLFNGNAGDGGNCYNESQQNMIISEEDEDESYNLGKNSAGVGVGAEKKNSKLMMMSMKDEKDIEGKEIDFEEKDENYTENVIFQSERTEKMNTDQYLEYNACRQHSFITKGKKLFMDYLESILTHSFPIELKDYNNIELIAFILKEEIKKIIIESIKDKHPQRKLFLLNYPLLKEDIAEYCNEENMKLTDFLNDFHGNVSMIKEFKKRHVNDKKPSNKNVKVKKDDDGIFIIIKRLALIENKEEAELFRNKRNAELHAMNALFIMKEKYVLLKNKKSATMQKGVHIGDEKLNFNFINRDQADISIKELLEFLGIDNYYEYFLVKDFIKEVNIKTIKPLELISRISHINKMNSKKLSGKFSLWQKMSNDERTKFIEDFSQLIKADSKALLTHKDKDNDEEL